MHPVSLRRISPSEARVLQAKLRSRTLPVQVYQRPIPGIALARQGHPARQRAAYRRTRGTEQFLGFYDVHENCLMGKCRRHKRVRDLLAAFTRLRACYPPEVRLYVVMDNLNTHRHPSLRAFFDAQQITVVPTPPYASWLNVIEPHLGAKKWFVLNGSDDPSHLIRRRCIARYLTWRNRHAHSPPSPLYKFMRIKLVRHTPQTMKLRRRVVA